MSKKQTTPKVPKTSKTPKQRATQAFGSTKSVGKSILKWGGGALATAAIVATLTAGGVFHFKSSPDAVNAGYSDSSAVVAAYLANALTSSKTVIYGVEQNENETYNLTVNQDGVKALLDAVAEQKYDYTSWGISGINKSLEGKYSDALWETATSLIGEQAVSDLGVILEEYGAEAIANWDAELVSSETADPVVATSYDEDTKTTTTTTTTTTTATYKLTSTAPLTDEISSAVTEAGYETVASSVVDGVQTAYSASYDDMSNIYTVSTNAVETTEEKDEEPVEVKVSAEHLSALADGVATTLEAKTQNDVRDVQIIQLNDGTYQVCAFSDGGSSMYTYNVGEITEETTASALSETILDLKTTEAWDAKNCEDHGISGDKLNSLREAAGASAIYVHKAIGNDTVTITYVGDDNQVTSIVTRKVSLTAGYTEDYNLLLTATAIALIEDGNQKYDYVGNEKELYTAAEATSQATETNTASTGTETTEENNTNGVTTSSKKLTGGMVK